MIETIFKFAISLCNAISLIIILNMGTYMGSNMYKLLIAVPTTLAYLGLFWCVHNSDKVINFFRNVLHVEK